MSEVILDYLSRPSPCLILLIPLLAFLEAAPIVGVFVSGIFLLSTATLLYTTGTASMAVILALAFFGAAAGDLAGYLFGRLFANKSDRVTFLDRHQARVQKAADLMRRSAIWSVLIGRLTPALRAVVPMLIGVSDMPFKRFLLYDLMACVVWVVGLSLILQGVSLIEF